MTKSWPTFCSSVMCFIIEITRPRYGASPGAVAAGGPNDAAITRDKPMTSSQSGVQVRRVGVDRANTGASEIVLSSEMEDPTTLSLTARIVHRRR